ncbi:hypothetical protein ACXIVC_21820 [Vibrio parahaemolyticus]
MSEKQTLMSMLSEFSNSVQELIGEISGQKVRFTNLVDQMLQHVNTVNQHVQGMAASLLKAKEYESQCSDHVTNAAGEAEEAKQYKSNASDSAYKAAQRLADCQSVKQQVENQVYAASQFTEQSRQHSQDSALSSDQSSEHADRSERARDESYLAVAGIAADLQELKAQLSKNNGIA